MSSQINHVDPINKACSLVLCDGPYNKRSSEAALNLISASNGCWSCELADESLTGGPHSRARFLWTTWKHEASDACLLVWRRWHRGKDRLPERDGNPNPVRLYDKTELEETQQGRRCCPISSSFGGGETKSAKHRFSC